MGAATGGAGSAGSVAAGKAGAGCKLTSNLGAATGSGGRNAPIINSKPWIASEAPKAKRSRRLVNPSCLPLSKFIALC
jgi:hypothetical protein